MLKGRSWRSYLPAPWLLAPLAALLAWVWVGYAIWRSWQ